MCLEDLFGIATTAAGKGQLRDGVDILGVMAGKAQPRESLFGFYGEPGKSRFKIMVRHGPWKYIYIANGGREQLFNLSEDGHELTNLASSRRDVADKLRRQAIAACRHPGAVDALAGDDLLSFPFAARPMGRVYQFDKSRGVNGFPARPQDGLEAYRARTAGKA